MHGKTDHPDSGILRHDVARGFHPVHVGHIDVHEDEIRPYPSHNLDRLPAIRGLSHDGKLTIGFKNTAKLFPDHLVIIHEDDANQGAGGFTRMLHAIGEPLAVRRDLDRVHVPFDHQREMERRPGSRTRGGGEFEPATKQFHLSP